MAASEAKEINLEAMEFKPEFIEGKVDWKGRTAVKNKHGGTRTSLLILTAFGFENMATLALAVNLVTYFNEVMHYELADAANQLTNYMGVSYILSIVMATLADTFVGRFNTVLIAGFLEFSGLALLTAQSHYPQLKPPICNVFDPTSHCEKLSGGNAALLSIALYMLAAGASGVKAALPSHGADQFDEKDPKEAKQMSSFFNLLLLAVCVGGAVSITLIVWIQDNRGWDWGFGISTIAMFLGVVIFAAGLPMYRIQVVQGSTAIIEILQVYVAAIRNRKLKLPENPEDLYEINGDKEAAVEAEFLPHRDTFSTVLVKIVNVATKGTTRSGGWLAGNNINRNHLNLFYWLLSILSLVNFFIYLFVATRYKYRPQSHNISDEKNNKTHEMREY
ncbi:hypothetical protein FEM48_Zijuj01G0054300 [Ziziphus jujuba var. spinosa]|uniref:Protein NRT1/ PTR FAMILY 4.5-like n=1 Tax=Ziziphus jujuba var. spinosa TaxID=714518 RepID=A0A978VZD7_ZIZJJ|nr:hypothetical protein FEM48_Zijuj01G0054300 [Ziziphus jujuba var. spinosa]